ncbi:MAG: flagellar M-ring protein FliF [Campylobacteraceae bacterium]|nr:flagellar M-ring protein FliF [Campylobacteraceae bacterium]
MEQLFKFVNNLSSSQRAVIMGGFSLLFVLLIGLLVYSSIKAEDKKLNYVIATNLTKSQVMNAGNELEAAGIKYLVSGNGESLTLKTSKEFINIAKIKLVTSSASTTKHVGWEIFEKSSLGTTNFENKVKYLRALEGELSRSLESLSGIISASVKIAIPKDTIFTERKIKPTASAVISLKPGIFLTRKQINGIKNFIASAVSSLNTEDINLIDQNGALLEENEDDSNNKKSFAQDKYKKKLEKDFENKIISLLEPVIGFEKVVARVSLNLTYINRRIQEEIYNPEGTIRSSQTNEMINSSTGSLANKGGVPGVQSNIEDPTENESSNLVKSNTESTKNIVNYEISKKVIDEKYNSYSNINRVTTAVTFDSTVLKDVENKDEFLASITSIVEEAVSYDKKRGDKVTVRNFKFLGLIDSSKVLLDSNGNAISSGSVDDATMFKSLMKDFGEYVQYLIAAILLFIFYRKFIVNHEVVILGEKSDKKDDDDSEIELDFNEDFDFKGAQGRLKAKIKSQILNNLEGLDEESAAKFELLIEDLDKEVHDNPEEIATMIQLLLSEGDAKFKG